MIAVLVCLALAGCSQGSDELTLVETKSPVQLLRNEAWSRMPELMLKEAVDTTDGSSPCLDPDEDPNGTMRSWASTTVAHLNNSFAPRVTTVAEELAQSFAAQGWQVARTEEGSQTTFTLTKKGGIATIGIAAAGKSEGQRASIAITTSGPCVRTAGADSDEVKALERQG